MIAEDDGTAEDLRLGENASVVNEVSTAKIGSANETHAAEDRSSAPLAVRLQRFLSQLSDWRNRAREGELSDLIWGIRNNFV